MLKKVIAMILAAVMMLSLSACGNDKSAKLLSVSTGDSGVLGTDFQKDMNQSTSTKIDAICATVDGYYFEYDCMVYFVDKETGQSTVLCGKPDCDHTCSEGNTSCNAFTNTDFLTYYNGKIYYNNSDCVLENGSYVDKGERLFAMNVDGTDHDAVQSIEFVPGGNTSNYITGPIIHRGNAYFCYSGCVYMVSLNADIDTAVCIYGKEIIDDGSHIVSANELYYEFWADGDLMYFMAKNVKQSDGTYKDTLYSYDPANEKLTKVWEVPEKSEVGTWDTTGVSVTAWYVSNGYLYYYLSGNDLWYADLSTGKNAKLADVELEHGVAAFSSEYIIVMSKTTSGYYDWISGAASVSGGDTLYIYNYSGELVKEISLKDIYKENDTVSDCDILFCDDGKIYIHANATVSGIYSANYSSSTIQEHYIYVVDIASGTSGDAVWSYYKKY